NGQHSYYVEIRGLKNKKTPWYDVYGSQLLASDRSKNLTKETTPCILLKMNELIKSLLLP
ncbi:hypothetical protein, partial [Paenibacillus alginolyticus]|uniref:hypothetical protein n=1 Tax=Paenibacillus alginolyticus TaxID=59839 RepID=UPI001AD7F294